MSQTHLPKTIAILCQLCHRIALSRVWFMHDSAMLKAAFSIAFHNFFHCAELTGYLQKSNIYVRENRMLEIFFSDFHNTQPETVSHSRSVQARTWPFAPLGLLSSTAYFVEALLCPFPVTGASLTRLEVTHHLHTLLPACIVPSAMGLQYSSHSARESAPRLQQPSPVCLTTAP